MHAVDLEAVVRSDYPAVIRMAAQRFLKDPYLDVGTFLKELNKADLEELVNYCHVITVREETDFKVALESICLLGEMAAQAEGTPLDGPDLNRTSNMIILLTFEDLARKGIIDFDRETATLGSDLVSLNLARLKGPQ